MKIRNYLKKINELDNILKQIIDNFPKFLNEKINYILDWLKSPIRTEKINLSELNLESAYKKSEEWHNSLTATGKITDETGKVFIEFDDGYYWIDLQTTYSEDEAKAMGHCGKTNEGDTLFSLRDKNKSPHITVAYDTKNGVIYQMKGKNNRKPIDKYHPYIYRLLVDPILKPKYFGYEWNKEEDFNLSDFDKETFNKVYKYNPNLIYNSINYDHKMCKGLIQKNYLDKEDIKDVLINSKDVNINIIMDMLDTDLFTKDELKEMLKISKFSPKDWSDLTNIKLYNEGLISIEQLAKKFNEIEIIDGVGYIDGDEDDLSHFMDDSVKSILFDDVLLNVVIIDMDSSEHVWDYLTKENKEKVIQKILEYGKSLQYKNYRIDKQFWFFNLKPTKEMFQWIEEKKDYFFVYNNYHYEISILIDNNKDNDLYELYKDMNRSLISAQRTADENEYYKKAKKEVIYLLGEFKRESIKSEINGKTYYKEVFRFKADDLCDWSRMVDFLEYDYSYQGEIDWEEEKYGDLWSILREMIDDKAEINDDYGIYGIISSEVLNDYFSEYIK